MREPSGWVLWAAASLAGCGSTAAAPTPNGDADGVRVSIRGTVVDSGGVPAVAAQVVLGDGTEAITAGDGTFSFDGVTLPYDVMVRGPNDSFPTAYLAVTTIAPVLYSEASGVRRNGAASGSYAGGEVFPQMPSHDTVAVLVVDTIVGQNAQSPQPLGGFDLTQNWVGAQTTPATVRAIQRIVDPMTDLPTSYTHVGELEVMLEDGAPSTGNVLTLDPVGTTTIMGDITVPTDYTLASVYLSWRRLTFLYDDAPSSSFGYPVPAVPDPVVAMIRANGPDRSIVMRRHAQPGSGGLVAVIPEPARPLTPGNAASMVETNETFSWTPTPGGAYSLVIVEVPSAAVVAVVYTTASAITLPNLAPVGSGLAPGTSYQWRVTSLGPADIDDITTGAQPISVALNDGGWFGSGGTGDFTTAP